MTFKKKSNVPINAISSTSGEFNKFANGNSYNNPARNNNRGRFPPSNRLYNKRTYANVSYKSFFLLNTYNYKIVLIIGRFSKTNSCKQQFDCYNTNG